MRLSPSVALLLAASACTPSTENTISTPLFGVGTSPTIVFQARVVLQPVGSIPGASGSATLTSLSRNGAPADQRIHVQVQGVAIRLHDAAAAAVYDVVVDNVVIDKVTRTPGGTFEAVYEPNPTGSHRLLPPPVQDVTKIRLIEIRSAESGEVLLQGLLASPPTIERFEATLAPTGVDPDAKGEVEIEVETENGTTEQTLDLEVEDLAAHAGFRLVVDGAEAGSLTTNANGKAELVLSSVPKGSEQPLPPSLPDLRKIKLIEITDANGQVILIGTPH